MKKSSTSERLKELMAMNGWKQIDILRKVEPTFQKYDMSIDRSYISLWVSGRFEPNQQRLTALAEALGVSETWLMGYDVPMNKQIEIDYESLGVKTKEQFDRITAYHDRLMKLSDKDREFVLDLIDRLLENNG